MSRTIKVSLLVILAIALLFAGYWFRADFLSWGTAFLALDKDQLELWEKRGIIIATVLGLLGTVGGIIWGVIKFILPWVTNDSSKVSSEQRKQELLYLQRLGQQYDLPLVQNAYTSQSGDMQAYKHLPEAFFKASLRYDRQQCGDEPHTINTVPKHHDDLLAAFEQYRHLVLLGEPGMGKTFSLKRIAAEYAVSAQKSARKPIPVIVPLNEWLDVEQSLDDFVKAQLGVLEPFWAELQAQKRLLPLFDALNEIPVGQRDKKLVQVADWVKRKTDFPALLLTCRLRDYTLALVQDLDRLTIEELTPPRIRDFLHNYFHHMFKDDAATAHEKADALFWELAGGEAMQEAWQRWQAYSVSWQQRLRHLFDQDYTHPTFENFWQPEEPKGWYWQHYWEGGTRLKHLNNSRSLMKLAKVPYLLSMMAKIFHEKGSLPTDSKRTLFEYFVDVLVDREAGEKNRLKESVPQRTELDEGLKRLAWELQSRGDASTDEVQTTLLRAEAELVVESELIHFAQASNLLDIVGDKLRFSHQLLQEFFTAQSFREKRDAGLLAKELWKKDWWQANGWEVATELAFEYEDDPVAFLSWLAEGNPKLAAQIARDQKVELDGLFTDYKSEWQNAIIDVVKYPNPHERHAISMALAWLGWDNRFGIGLDDNGIPEMDWVLIPDGEFYYQNDETRTEADFQISRYPVTNQQFQAFVADGGYDTVQWWEGLDKPDAPPVHRWQESNRPAENVSWYDAIAFCRWLSAKTGQDIRLPTEQQWEKAARNGDKRQYPWGGDKYITGSANINETWEHGKVGEYNLQETSAVGIYPQQAQLPYELHDMAGNVWEWCLNKYDNPDKITTDLSNDDRVVRGGSWRYSSVGCRSSFRGGGPPLGRDGDQGFRCCCFPPISEH